MTEKAKLAVEQVAVKHDHAMTPQEMATEKVVSVFSDYPGNFYAIMSTGRIFQRGGTAMAPTWVPIAAPLEGGRITSTSISVHGVIYAVTEDGKIFERRPNPKVYEMNYQYCWMEIPAPTV